MNDDDRHLWVGQEGVTFPQLLSCYPENSLASAKFYEPNHALFRTPYNRDTLEDWIFRKLRDVPTFYHNTHTMFVFSPEAFEIVVRMLHVITVQPRDIGNKILCGRLFRVEYRVARNEQEAAWLSRHYSQAWHPILVLPRSKNDSGT